MSPPEVSPSLATTEVIFRKLLVAIDFGPQTSQVLKTAVAVAKSFRAEMLLVHAVCPVILGTGAEPVPADSYLIALEAARTRMADLVRREVALESIQHREIVEYAAAIELVGRKVHDERVDLVIAGSIGDVRQHQGVDAGKPFEQLQESGMRTALLDRIALYFSV